MTSISLFDWTTYRHLFSAKDMENVFGERGTFEAIIEVEKALARAQSEFGIIPIDAAAVISERLSFDKLDLEKLHMDTVDVGRPIVGLAAQLAQQVGPDYASWVHYGITTYDVMDTGRVLQIREGLKLVVQDSKKLRQTLMALAKEHRSTVTIGRTNVLHAQPTTFGAKIAPWIEELMRHEQRIKEIEKRVLVVQFGGAVGTLASLYPHGLDFRKAVAKELNLGAVLSNWHNARDAMSELSLMLGNLCATLARIAQNIRNLSSTDISEVAETGSPGRGRSTSMAHKHNPRASEFAEATAKLGRQRSVGMLEVMGQEFDRCGSSWISEWMLIPETFLLTSSALSWTNDMFERLEVNTERMLVNIAATKGMALTERFTLRLAESMPKAAARQLVDEACARTMRNGEILTDVLLCMAEVSAVLSEAEVREMSDPATYIGSASDIVDRVLNAAELFDAKTFANTADTLRIETC